MGFGGLGMWEIILIFMVVLLLFGAKRLPEIGSSLGKGIREFKGSLREIEKEINTPQERDSISSGSTGSGQVSSKSKPSDAEEAGAPREKASADSGGEGDGGPRRLTTEG